MSFLPDEYESPVMTGGYLKIKDKETVKVRILGSYQAGLVNPQAVMGWEVWNVENKPVRRQFIPKDLTGHDELIPISKSPKDKPRFFWCFVVWDEIAEEILIWAITQKSIQSKITEYANNKSWGAPSNYILSITRTGSGMETDYSVIAEPPILEPDARVMEAWADAQIDLRVLFTGDNPFGALRAPEDEETPF